MIFVEGTDCDHPDTFTRYTSHRDVDPRDLMLAETCRRCGKVQITVNGRIWLNWTRPDGKTWIMKS